MTHEAATWTWTWKGQVAGAPAMCCDAMRWDGMGSDCAVLDHVWRFACSCHAIPLADAASSRLHVMLHNTLHHRHRHRHRHTHRLRHRLRHTDTADTNVQEQHRGAPCLAAADASTRTSCTMDSMEHDRRCVSIGTWTCCCIEGHVRVGATRNMTCGIRVMCDVWRCVIGYHVCCVTTYCRARSCCCASHSMPLQTLLLSVTLYNTHSRHRRRHRHRHRHRHTHTHTDTDTRTQTHRMGSAASPLFFFQLAFDVCMSAVLCVARIRVLCVFQLRVRVSSITHLWTSISHINNAAPLSPDSIRHTSTCITCTTTTAAQTDSETSHLHHRHVPQCACTFPWPAHILHASCLLILLSLPPSACHVVPLRLPASHHIHSLTSVPVPPPPLLDRYMCMGMCMLMS